MSIRKLAMLLAAVCAVALVAPVAAGAAQTRTPTAIPTTSFSHVPLTGTTSNGKAFTGHLDVTQFVTRGGKSYAVGTLTGKLGSKTIKQSNVAIPAKVGNATGTASAAATCPVLHLDLGPLNLNLLGLTVHLNEVVLDINAVSGAGNLLGNLLCGVSNLLNGTGASTLGTQQITGLLNIVQQLLNVPGLLTL
jgi:hypothetical protein